MFQFGIGLHEENDNRTQMPGAPRSVENLVRTKNGRLQARRDYETIAATGTGNNAGGEGTMSGLRLYDLAEYSGRLLGFGRADSNSRTSYAVDATESIFELLERPTGNWRRALSGDLAQATKARLIGRVGRKINSVEVLDAAAADGLVCLVYQAQLSVGGALSIGVHIIDAATDATVFSAGIFSEQRPRVVAMAGSFWIGSVVTSSGAIRLRTFTPASSTSLSSSVTVVAAGASVNAWDMRKSNGEDTLWIAVARSDTTSELRGIDDEGATIYTASGPAADLDGISVLHETATLGTGRLHLACVRETSHEIDLRTYEPPTTSEARNNLDIDADNASCQVGIEVALNTAQFQIYYTGDSGTSDDVVKVRVITASTLALVSVNSTGDLLNSLPLNIKGRTIFNAAVQEELSFYTNALLRDHNSANGPQPNTVCVWDRFLAHACSRFHLPRIAYDSDNDLAYVPFATEDTDRAASPALLELRIAGAERRQTVELGDILYITGAIVQAFDGRSAHEAGGFLTRPFISGAISGGTTGALDEGGTYQTVCVMEYRDSKNRRIRSAPSNLVETELLPTDDILSVTANPSLSLRDVGTIDGITPSQLQSGPALTFYRTLNIDDGQGTFHLDTSLPYPNLAIKAPATEALDQSDDDISDNEILYTQGARGALSGPLEFTCPDPAGSIAASADRILTGQLLNDTQIQESRPLFPGEQVQWNDTPGFFRDVRARMLAVARLDERRILFTATSLFECDGQGLDDNGLGEIGAPRRLPSDVGLYGGVDGWRSIIEISAGILFQGLRNQIYLLPRGGVTPIPIGFAIEDQLDAYPVIVAAVYMNEDQTVRFLCNNTTGDESIVLLFNVRFTEWFTEGPYAFAWRSAARAGGRFYALNSAGAVLRQRTELLPLAFIDNAWRSGTLHPFNPGMFGRVYAFWFYGTFRGNCRIRAIARWDDESTETHDWVDVVDLEDGAQFVFRFEFDQLKCESCTVDFEIVDFQGEASRGLEYNYWAIEREPSGVPNQIAPELMS
jgi:hypothetical protein